MALLDFSPGTPVNRGAAEVFKSPVPQQMAIMAQAQRMRMAQAKLDQDREGKAFEWLGKIIDEGNDKEITTEQEDHIKQLYQGVFDTGAQLNMRGYHPLASKEFTDKLTEARSQLNKYVKVNKEIKAFASEAKDGGQNYYIDMDKATPAFYDLSRQTGSKIYSGMFSDYADQHKELWNGTKLGKNWVNSYEQLSTDESNAGTYITTTRTKYPSLFTRTSTGGALLDSSGKPAELVVSDEAISSIPQVNPTYDKWLKWNEQTNGIKYRDQAIKDAFSYGKISVEDTRYTKPIDSNRLSAGQFKFATDDEYVRNVHSVMKGGSVDQKAQLAKTASVPERGIRFEYDENNDSFVPILNKAYLMNPGAFAILDEYQRKQLDSGEIKLPPIKTDDPFQATAAMINLNPAISKQNQQLILEDIRAGRPSRVKGAWRSHSGSDNPEDGESWRTTEE